MIQTRKKTETGIKSNQRHQHEVIDLRFVIVSVFLLALFVVLIARLADSESGINTCSTSGCHGADRYQYLNILPDHEDASIPVTIKEGKSKYLIIVLENEGSRSEEDYNSFEWTKITLTFDSDDIVASRYTITGPELGRGIRKAYVTLTCNNVAPVRVTVDAVGKNPHQDTLSYDSYTFMINSVLQLSQYSMDSEVGVYPIEVLPNEDIERVYIDPDPELDGMVNISQRNLTDLSSGVPSSIDLDILDPNAVGNINFNEPEIVDLARKISGDSNEIPEIVWETYDWVVENINYQQLAGERDAAATLKNREGGSAELGNLQVALLRANGIPARRVSGYGNHFHEGEELYLSQFAHGWTEFYLPNYGWIPSDPTWGQANEFDNFAKTDDNHIALTTGAGIHFLTRSDVTEPFGDTDVNTDYKLTILDINITNLSTERDIIRAIIFGIPVVFAVFILNKRLRQRHV